ncbi:MAG TPA: YggT family protein [Gammaproteobacteria bacterium]|nr:YggT family protein [Gammaproteobacteria bacterium]
MGNPYASDAATLLIQTLFGLYILVVLLRFLLQLVRADFYNPISQFIVKATQPPLGAMRRIIPGFGGVDLASLVLMFGLQCVEIWLLLEIHGKAPTAPGIAMLAVAELLKLTIYLYFFSIIVQVVLSWLNPHAHNPITALIFRLNEPLLLPARRLLPPFSGVDLSPLLVLVALQLALILIVRPIRDMALPFF